MEHPFPAGPRARAKVFERAAKAALASGRTRDAEVTLIAACRENAKASSRPTVPLARVHSALGELYAATSAQSAPAGPEQSRLLERARQALTLAAGIYAGALGPNASRSRQALLRIERLDSDVLEIGAQNAQQQTRREVEQQMPREAHHASREAVPLRQVVQERQRSPVQDPPSRTVRNRSVVNEPAAPEPVPSVRSLVQADPELRQFEADLARLHEQAAAVSEDPEGLRHRSDLAQAQRNHCRDTACLRRWYVRRRAELIEEF
jgi:hypothetical protein